MLLHAWAQEQVRAAAVCLPRRMRSQGIRCVPCCVSPSTADTMRMATPPFSHSLPDRPEEIKGGRQAHHGQDELFTRSAGGIRLATYSIACVDELCVVLKFSQYCRYQGDARRNDLLRGGHAAAGDKQSVYFIRDGKDAARQSERVKAQATKRQRTSSHRDPSPRKQAKVASNAVNKRNSKGETRLHAAAGRGDNKAVLGLLNQRAEVNVKCNAGSCSTNKRSDGAGSACRVSSRDGALVAAVLYADARSMLTRAQC